MKLGSGIGKVLDFKDKILKKPGKSEYIARGKFRVTRVKFVGRALARHFKNVQDIVAINDDLHQNNLSA